MHCTSLQLKTVQRGFWRSRGLSLYSLLVCEGLIQPLPFGSNLDQLCQFYIRLANNRAMPWMGTKKLLKFATCPPSAESAQSWSQCCRKWSLEKSAKCTDVRWGLPSQAPNSLGSQANPDKASNLHSPSGERSCSHCIRDTLSCIHFAKLRVAPDWAEGQKWVGT